MNLRNQVFRCNVCKNLVEVYSAGTGQMHCCGKPMDLLREGTSDGAKEKHIPVVEHVNNGIKVTVGSVTHPMEEKHYIEWIEVIAGDKIYREHLKPGMKPEAWFPVNESNIIVREYCNLHGLWKNGD